MFQALKALPDSGRRSVKDHDEQCQQNQHSIKVGEGSFRYRSAISALAAKIGGTSAEVSFAGAQGSLTGVDQVNMRIPRSLIGRGNVDVVLQVDG